MTVIIEQPMTKREHQAFIAIGITAFSLIIFALTHFAMSTTMFITGWIATSIGITGFIIAVKYGEVES